MKAVRNKTIEKDFKLISKVREIHKQTRGAYGSRRMSKKLRAEGYDVGRHQARTLMKKAKVEYKLRKKFKRTTDSTHNLPVAGNLLNRDFNTKHPNTVWCTDISYLWTIEGWLYLAVVMDLYSRKIVGWTLSNTLKTSLAKEALEMAYWRRKPKEGLLHHSDRGSQYASETYQKLLSTYKMTCSMSRKGNCWDNAVVESFFSSLKTERANDTVYRTRNEARQDVFDYIEMFYNSNRLHSHLEYKSPNEYEKEPKLEKAA